jgi:hypothetical protein
MKDSIFLASFFIGFLLLGLLALPHVLGDGSNMPFEFAVCLLVSLDVVHALSAAEALGYAAETRRSKANQLSVRRWVIFGLTTAGCDMLILLTSYLLFPRFDLPAGAAVALFLCTLFGPPYALPFILFPMFFKRDR